MVWFILFVVLSLILIILYFNRKKYLETQYKNDFLNKKQEELNELYLVEKKKHDKLINEEEIRFQQQNKVLEERKRSIEETIVTLNEKKELLEKQYENQIAHEKEIIKQKLITYASVEEEKTKQQLVEYKTEQTAKITAEVQEFLDKSNIAKAEKQAELDTLNILIEDFKKKQQVINEEILRRRQVEEQQDFYRIELSESAIQDMQILLGIRQNLRMRENLDKLIYDAYVAKPAAEMIKRVLQGRAPSGIYKITRLKTGEIYIGKSTDVKKRWGEHAKTSYGVGSIAHSMLHTTIKKDGIENFTFELLEEVPKDKLTEREKYWINFYNSKNYGLNEREG